jgi:hypothetical protein
MLRLILPSGQASWDAEPKPRELCIGIGPAADVQIARRWLPRLNSMGVAREKSARRYRDWPGAQQALGVTFVIEDRFVRPLDDDRLNLALHQDLRHDDNCEKLAG